ncbi:MAG: hypothetical protein WEA80_09160 [Gemmatimonadaceae bacterium]
MSQLTAAAEQIDTVADEGDDLSPDAETGRSDVAAARGGSALASKPVFIPAPVFKPEFIPATEFPVGDS